MAKPYSYPIVNKKASEYRGFFYLQSIFYLNLNSPK